MKLLKVKVKHPVMCDGSNREQLVNTFAQGLRFEAGFVAFSDKSGEHLIPIGNVRHMTIDPSESKLKKPRE